MRADSPEPSLLAYTKYGRGGWSRLQLKTLVPFETLAWAFKGGYARNTEIPCTGANQFEWNGITVLYQPAREQFIAT